jgi:hypothetical protein
MKIKKILFVFLCTLLLSTGCDMYELSKDEDGNNVVNKDILISDIINYPEFKGFGKLLFPDTIRDTDTLTDLQYVLKYHTEYSADKTIEIIDYLRKQVNDGNQVFYNIYTEEEMMKDASLKDVGIIYFRGDNNKPFTIHMAGGWEYVGSIHDSMPQAYELSKLGYNAFALVYRNNAWAQADLERAIRYINNNKESLNITNTKYSIWANAQASTVANNYSLGTTNKPTALVMQYNNLSKSVTGHEVPTYSVVGTGDQIISYKDMDERNTNLKALGVKAEIDMIVGLGHGFGVGYNTAAANWINRAVAFIESI